MRKPIALLTALVMVCSVVVPVGAVAAESPSQLDAAASPTLEDTETNETTDEHPPDPPEDRLGWENGYWYNETLSVTPDDGLNDSELEAVVARSMARVEVVRGIEFEDTPPVEVISREEYREQQNDSSDDNETSTDTNNRLHQNVKWEAMLSIGEDENALDTFESTQSATVGGYYSTTEKRIVIVSENTTTPQMDEITLSQELFHALQDQKLNISFNRSTREGINARNGIVEGDGNLVDRLYEQRCDEEWDCVIPESEGGSDGGGSDDINFGVYLTQFQPYSDGPKFVQQIYRDGGWDAVNAVYENPPTSSEQVIHTDKYPDEGPTNISFTDTSTDDWYVPDMGNGSVDYARYGQAGLSAMFMRTAYAQQGAPVVNPQEFLNTTAGGGVSDFDPLNYGLNVTNGWGNDRLYPYVTNDSIDTNETGYVWKIEWDTEADASEFADGYVGLLEYYGGQAVEGNESTYRIPDENEFGDAFYVGVDGSTVTLVNGPNVTSLSDIREGAAPAAEMDSNGTMTPDTTTNTTETAEDDTASGDGPGFGVIGALGAVVAAGLLALGRRD